MPEKDAGVCGRCGLSMPICGGVYFPTAVHAGGNTTPGASGPAAMNLKPDISDRAPQALHRAGPTAQGGKPATSMTRYAAEQAIRIAAEAGAMAHGGDQEKQQPLPGALGLLTCRWPWMRRWAGHGLRSH